MRLTWGFYALALGCRALGADFLQCAARTHIAAQTLTQHTRTHTLVKGHVSACPDGAPSILRTGSIMA
eukprot:6638998-Prymnesium_polylepis.2